MNVYKVSTSIIVGKPIGEVASVGEIVTRVRLVEANNKAQAKNHAANAHIHVELASSQDLIDLTKQGVEVEKVSS